MQVSLNEALWSQILDFNFDDTEGDYCFSVRLAQEQGWTENFTHDAISEYRKFMYLAATQDFMVSPSAIVDEVWHLHLIFTTSYQQFCRLLGKEIHHIPSTHNKAEALKFEKAKAQTASVYEAVFGRLPKAIWGVHTMEESLGLKSGGPALKVLVMVGMVALLLLFPLFFWTLKPLYAHLNNPYLMWGYGTVALLTILTLEGLNRMQFRQITSRFLSTAFPFNLTPAEAIFLKTGQASDAVADVVNRLVQKQVIVIGDHGILELQKTDASLVGEETIIAGVLEESGPMAYPVLLQQVLLKPRFQNIQNGGRALQGAIEKSGWFKTVFMVNLTVLGTLILLGITRVATGIARDKPVTFIVILVIVLFLVMWGYLYRLYRFGNAVTIPNRYKSELRGATPQSEWGYFLWGSAALTAAFAPIVQRTGAGTSSIGDGGDSSCGSSDGGSSCGGGCGGGD